MGGRNQLKATVDRGQKTEDRLPDQILVDASFHANAELIGIQSSILSCLFCPPTLVLRQQHSN